MTLQERKEQKKFLRHGDQTLLANLAGVTKNVVHRWLDGEQGESVVETYFVELVARRKKEQAEKFNQLNQH